MPTPDESLSLFTSVHNREAKQASTGWGLFSAKMDGGPEEDEAGKEVFHFVASEPKEDRHRDVVAPDWMLANFRSNPVLPWNHQSWAHPVGRGLSIELNADDQLRLAAHFDDNPVNPMGQLTAHQYREGFLNAVSVGFISGMATHRSDLDEGSPHASDRGYLLSRNELLEVSPVTIPALASALLQRGAGSRVIRSAGDFQLMSVPRRRTPRMLVESSVSPGFVRA